MTLNLIVIYTAGVFDILLGIFILSKNKSSQKNLSFFLFCLIIGIWSISVANLISAGTKDAIFFWLYIITISMPTISSTFLHMAYAFSLKEINSQLSKILFAYMLTPISILGFLLPNFYIRDVIFFSNGNKLPVIGIGYYLLSCLYAIILFIGFRQLFFSLKNSSLNNHEKETNKFIFYSLLLAIIFGSIFNWFFILLNNYRYIWLGPYSLFIVIFSTSLAILRHRLMDITVVIRKSLVYSIIIAAFTAFYLSIIFLISKSSIFTAFGSSLFSVIFIFLLAFIFQPLKAKLQFYIDKTFFYEKYMLEKSLKEFAEASITIIDLNELLAFTAKSLKASLSSKQIQILLLDKERGKYKTQAMYPYSQITTSISDNFPIVKELLNKKKIISIDEVEQEKRNELVSDLKNLEAHLAMPLVFKGALIGIILAGSKENMWPYSFEEFSLLSTLLPQLSIAIENARLIREHLDAQKQLAQTEKTKKIAEDLLRYRKESSGKKKLVNLNNTIEKILKLFEGTCEKKNIKIAKTLEEIPFIMANNEEMEQLFLNLVLNAMDAMNNGGILTITTTTKSKFNVEVRVSDTGTGIPQEQLAKIFEPFYTTKEDRAGLGLAIVKKVVEEHEGKINIESVEGKGTRVLVDL